MNLFNEYGLEGYLDFIKFKSNTQVPYTNITSIYKKKNSRLYYFNKNTIYNTYLNIHFLQQDFFLNKFINTVLLSKGEKHKAFNILIRSFKILKTITNISPIRIFKSLLKPEKLFFVHFIRIKGDKVLEIPKISDRKLRYEKYFSYLKSSLKNMEIDKQFSIDQKLSYLVLNEVLSKNKDWIKFINLNASSFYPLKKKFMLRNS